MFSHMVYKSGQIFLPFCHNSRVWRTDGRTDGRTDRILIARPCRRGKNYSIWSSMELPNRLGGLGDRHERQNPAENWIQCFLSSKKVSGWDVCRKLRSYQKTFISGQTMHLIVWGGAYRSHCPFYGSAPDEWWLMKANEQWDNVIIHRNTAVTTCN